MNLTGKVHEIGQTQQVTETIKKRELIIEYVENPQYPEYLKFEAIQDRCALFDKLSVGQDVDLHFNLKGRPWTDKTGKKSYFNTLQVWKVDVVGAKQAEYAAPATVDDDSSDLPF